MMFKKYCINVRVQPTVQGVGMEPGSLWIIMQPANSWIYAGQHPVDMPSIDEWRAAHSKISEGRQSPGGQALHRLPRSSAQGRHLGGPTD